MAGATIRETFYRAKKYARIEFGFACDMEFETWERFIGTDVDTAVCIIINDQSAVIGGAICLKSHFTICTQGNVETLTAISKYHFPALHMKIALRCGRIDTNVASG